MKSLKTMWCAGLCLIAMPSLAMAQGQYGFQHDCWGVHQMHAHHVASMHHAQVLDSYCENLETIPKDLLQDQVQVIQREAVASRKWLSGLPKERLAGDAADSVKGIKQSHTKTIQAAKAISNELENETVNYSVISQNVNQMSTALRGGESHIHQAYQQWKLNPIQRRLHPSH